MGRPPKGASGFEITLHSRASSSARRFGLQVPLPDSLRTTFPAEITKPSEPLGASSSVTGRRNAHRLSRHSDFSRLPPQFPAAAWGKPQGSLPGQFRPGLQKGSTVQNHVAGNAVEQAATEERSFVTFGAGAIAGTLQLAIAKQMVLAGKTVRRANPIHLSDVDFHRVITDLLRRRDAVAEGYLKWATGRKFASREETILGILKKASISVTESGFNDPAKERVMRERILEATRHGGPLYLPLSLGGIKAPNPLKTGYEVLPDLAEWQAWLQFDALARAVDGVVVPIPDAPLMAEMLEFSAEAMHRHTRQAQEDLRLLGLTDRVLMPETRDYLPSDWDDTVKSITRAIRERATRDPATIRRVLDQAQSLQFIADVRKLRLSDEEHVFLGAALAGDRSDAPAHILQLADEVAARTRDSTPAYMAVNEAIRALDLAGRIVKAFTGRREHLRISVHAKHYEPRPRLVFERNRHVASMALLPMHGLGLRAEFGETSSYGIGFELVNRVEAARPVMHGGRFMWFEPAPGTRR